MNHCSPTVHETQNSKLNGTIISLNVRLNRLVIYKQMPTTLTVAYNKKMAGSDRLSPFLLSK